MEHSSSQANFTTNKVGVVGLGYVGLPLALTFTNKDFNVVGIDINPERVNQLRSGKSYLNELSDVAINKAINSKKLIPTTDYSLLQDVDTIIICVPTPLDSESNPDLTYLKSASQMISKQLRQGQLIVLESSTYPGTTSEVVLPILEKSGMAVGTDFSLGYSPERIDPGNKKFGVTEVPKVISGLTHTCLSRLHDVYKHVFNNLVEVSNIEVAELTKLVENCHRLINISFVNELAIICDSLNINVWEVLEAASTKPYGFTPYYPGPGIGGHCIPVDPLYLQWKISQLGIKSQFINHSMTINNEMPSYVVSRMKKSLSPSNDISKSSILVYGVTYKPDINDVRESPALPIIKLLQNEGASVHYHDPYVPKITVNEKELTSVPLTTESLENVDCILILTNHSNLPIQKIADHASLIFDTRHVTKDIVGKARIIQLGGGTK